MLMKIFIEKLYVSIQDSKHKKKSAKGDNKTEYTLISPSLSSNNPNVNILQYRSSWNTRNRDELTTKKKKEKSNQPAKPEGPLRSCSIIQAVQ